MRKISIIIVGIFLFLGNSYSQPLNRSGLKFYNPFLNNPALIEAKKTLQFDIMTLTGTELIKQLNISIYTILSPNEDNSSYLVKYGILSTNGGNSQDLSFGYSYSFKLKEDLHLLTGIGLGYIFSKYPMRNFSVDENRKGRYIDLGIGTGLLYKKLTVGFGFKSNIWNKSNYVWNSSIGSYEAGSDTGNWDLKNMTTHLYAKYDILTNFNLIISPNIYYNTSYYNGYNPNNLHIGLFIEYHKVIGIGTVYQTKSNYLIHKNLFMFSCSLKLFNKIRFITFFNPNYNKIYEKESGWNLLGQLRINI